MSLCNSLNDLQNARLYSLPDYNTQMQAAWSDTIKTELAPYLKFITPPAAGTELLTRKEAAKMLSISLPTLHQWSLAGKIKGYRIGTRVRYKKAELESALSQMVTE